MTTIREALLAMGYTERKPGHWLKPVGYHCFTYHEGKNEWANWFKHANEDKILLWQTHSLQDDIQRHGEYIYQLKYFECYTRTDIPNMSHFEMDIPDI